MLYPACNMCKNDGQMQNKKVLTKKQLEAA